MEGNEKTIYNDKLNYIVPPKPYKKGPIARCTTDKLAMGPFYRFFPIKRVYYLYYYIEIASLAL